ncbi:hypothetical protein ACS0TY_026620 [Phlomoides rotata]
MEFKPEHFITYVSGKYPRLWALKGTNPIDVRQMVRIWSTRLNLYCCTKFPGNLRTSRLGVECSL